MRMRATITPVGLIKRKQEGLTEKAKRRLKWIEYYDSHGQNASLTCRHFDIERPTFYRWLKRYREQGLKGLEDKSSKPKRCRQREWTRDLLMAVKRLREKYQRWGKDKLVILLRQEGFGVSASTVGRIIKYLKKTRDIVEAPLVRVGFIKRKKKRGHAVRLGSELMVKAPGDLLQLDTLHVRLDNGQIVKQFTGIDLRSKWIVSGVYMRATARSAASFLRELVEKMPFKIKAIQVDNGSEFMAAFEESCRELGIKLYLIPPRSPKLNGCVERMQRTHREEFWGLSEMGYVFKDIEKQLRKWEYTYNHIRPHQSLGYLTPAQVLASQVKVI